MSLVSEPRLRASPPSLIPKPHPHVHCHLGHGVSAVYPDASPRGRHLDASPRGDGRAAFTLRRCRAVVVAAARTPTAAALTGCRTARRSRPAARHGGRDRPHGMAHATGQRPAARHGGRDWPHGTVVATGRTARRTLTGRTARQTRPVAARPRPPSRPDTVAPHGRRPDAVAPCGRRPDRWPHGTAVATGRCGSETQLWAVLYFRCVGLHALGSCVKFNP